MNFCWKIALFYSSVQRCFFFFVFLFCFVFNLISCLLKTITTSPWNPSVTHFVIFSPVIVTCHPETIVLKWYFCLFVFIIQDCLYWVSRNVFPLYVYSSTLCCAPLSDSLKKISIDYFSVERWNSLLNFLNIYFKNFNSYRVRKYLKDHNVIYIFLIMNFKWSN